MEEKQQYLGLISEIIAKQGIILGPEIAILKAKAVPGLTINNKGEATDISGDPSEAVENLIDEYVNLSGQIVKSALSSVFSRYPSLKKGE
jgi:hypothetical protein